VKQPLFHVRLLQTQLLRLAPDGLTEMKRAAFDRRIGELGGERSSQCSLEVDHKRD